MFSIVASGVVLKGESASVPARKGDDMKRLIKLPTVIAVTLTAMAVFALPAEANTKVTTVIHDDETWVESGMCPFDITFHQFGTFKAAEYFDNDGFHYKTIVTVGHGGPFTITFTAKGTTLTMQNQAAPVVITFNADGSRDTETQYGPIFKFTLPGSGVVLLDAGRLTFEFDGDGNVVSVSVAGPHQALDGDFDAFCAAFG